MHDQVEAVGQTGQVLAVEKEQRGLGRKAVQRPPAGAVGTTAAQARYGIPAEHDQTSIDPSFTSLLTGVVVRLTRNTSRAASPDPIDDARHVAARARAARGGRTR